MGVFPGIPNLLGPSTWPPVFVAEMILGASAPQFPTLKFVPMSGLLLFINVTGYGGTDVVSLRFNGDSGANYWDRTLVIAAGGTAVAETSTTSTTLIRCGKPINKGRAVMAQIVNFATKSKVVQVMNQYGSGAANTLADGTVSTSGEWINTTDLISQIDVLTAGGANILAGSSLVLYGYNRAM